MKAIGAECVCKLCGKICAPNEMQSLHYWDLTKGDEVSRLICKGCTRKINEAVLSVEKCNKALEEVAVANGTTIMNLVEYINYHSAPIDTDANQTNFVTKRER